MEGRVMIKGVSVAGVASFWVLGACALQPMKTAEDVEPPHARITTDGSTAEWPEGVSALMDNGYLHVRFSPPGAPRTLQASGTTTTILLDTDMDAETGRRERGVGAELAIELSPEDRGHGVAVTRYDRAGVGESIGHAAVDFHFSPTYAAEEYEARVALRTSAKDGAGTIHACRGIVMVDDDPVWGESFEVIPRWWHEDVPVPPVMSPAPLPTIAGLPRSADGAVRVMSWNVLRGAPEESPETFARVILNADPDVVLVQEWDGADGEQLARWFNEHVGGVPAWTASARPAGGVGVVTRHVIVAEQEEQFPVEGEWPVRCHGVIVRTPTAELLCASMHLKCCGSTGSDEDLRRMRETRAISEGLHRAFPGATPDTVVIGGDLNLVGSRGPLDVLAGSLDVDGSEMAIAAPRVLGDNAYYTWTEDRSSFSPGRLDWILVGDAHAGIADAFVLDARKVMDVRRIATALRTGDTSVSDHLPVVVDVVIEHE